MDSSKVAQVRELCPHLSEEFIGDLLRQNGGNVERTVNTALELASDDNDRFGHTTHSVTAKAAQNGNIGKGNSSESLAESTASASSSKSWLRRGSAVPLPDRFLIIPEFRRCKYVVKSELIEFSVTYRRQSRSLGLSIMEVEGEIAIVAVDCENTSKCLAAASGVQVGDILIGINQDICGIDTDTQDIIEFIAKSGTYITLHFHRRYNLTGKLKTESLHPAIPYLAEQGLINHRQVVTIDRTLKLLKSQWLGFDEGLAAERILVWRLDEVLQDYWDDLVSADSPKPLSSVGRRASYTGYAAGSGKKEEAPQRGSLRRFSSSGALQGLSSGLLASPFDQSKAMSYLRPALMVHILRAERDKKINLYEETELVLWCADVLSGSEWVVRRTIGEVLVLRRKLIKAKHKVQAMAFPPAPRSRSASLTSIDSEIVPQILRFLRDILSVYQVNLMHPSSIRMALLMQDFLGVKDYLVQIRARERQVQNKHTKYVQVYIHHVMHISSIRSIVRSFVEEFMASKVKDVSVAWTEESASNVINNLKQFMDNMQSFLITAFKKDCAEMVADLCEKGEQLYGKGRDIAQAVANMTFTDLSNVSSKRVEEVRESMLQELEEEMESITRAAVRRQVELDVYIPCMGRASFIMQKTLAAKDTKLFEKMKVLLPQPQSYYDIPLQHISPCSWFPIVTAFQDIKNIVLPCDKVQHLLQLSTAIPTLFRAEHPLSEQTLGADDLFPIFIYIVVQSKLPALWTLSQEMQQLCDPDHAFSEAGYYLATLQAALQHLLDVNLKLDRPFDQSHKR